MVSIWDEEDSDSQSDMTNFLTTRSDPYRIAIIRMTYEFDVFNIWQKLFYRKR